MFSNLGYPEYWILDVAVDRIPPIRTLNELEAEEEYGYRKGHGLDRTALVEVLNNLFDEWYIQALVERQVTHGSVSMCLDNLIQIDVPSKSEIAEILDGDGTICYCMTQLGAAIWETMSKPNWDLYAYGGLCFDPLEFETTGGFSELEGNAANRQCLEGLLEKEDFVRHIVPESISWVRESPWNALYWKTLPESWTLRFKTRGVLSGESSDLLVANNNWYTNPFEA